MAFSHNISRNFSGLPVTVTPAEVFNAGASSDNCGGTINLVSVTPNTFGCLQIGVNAVTLVPGSTYMIRVAGFDNDVVGNAFTLSVTDGAVLGHGIVAVQRVDENDTRFLMRIMEGQQRAVLTDCLAVPVLNHIALDA